MKKSNIILNAIEKAENEIKAKTSEINKHETISKELYKNYRENKDINPEAADKYMTEHSNNYIILNNLRNEIDKMRIEKDFLTSNYRAAVYNEIMPDIINVLNKYTGKKIGPKTREKINNELCEISEHRIYIYNQSEYTSDHKIVIYLNREINISYPCNEIEIYFKFDDENKKRYDFIDENGKAIKFTGEIFLAPYKNKYYDDIKKAVNDYYKYLNDINKMQNELDALKSEYNAFIPANIKRA